MTKTEFLHELYNHLQPLPESERADIISDFEEHFSAGIENGKTEEQICEELGNPYSCALQYLRQTPPKNKQPEAGPVRTAQYQAIHPNNSSRNHFWWSILFFAGVFAAIGVYPVSVGMMGSFFGVIIVTAVTAALTSSAVAFGFLLSLSLFLLFGGLCLFLLMTWFLKLSWQKAEL